MPSEHVLEICSSDATVTSELAKSPHKPVQDIVRSLSKKWNKRHRERKSHPPHDDNIQEKDHDEVAACGRFTSRPSELFLKIYRDILGPLDKNPMAGVVSPPLLASTGVIPLSIVSVIPDIMRHYAELIIHARSEVFLATNYWEMSHSSKVIRDSLIELSKRTEGTGRKIVVKIIYDRGFLGQLLTNRVFVKPEAWSKVGLPTENEIPNVHLEVINFHRMILGTFHAKFLIVDREMVCLNSNNIQDRPNVEMMIHIEGPIVDSFYDLALVSWAKAMDPPLSLLSMRRANYKEYKFGDMHERLKYIDTTLASKLSRALINKQLSMPEADEEAVRRIQKPLREQIADSMRSDLSPPGINDSGFVATHPGMNVPTLEEEERRTEGTREVVTDYGGNNSTVSSPASENSLLAPVAIAIPQTKENSSSRSRLQAICDHLNSGMLNNKSSETTATAQEDDLIEDFRPHIMHQAHEPVPMVLVNRRPKGRPGHSGVYSAPQNVAWLSGLKHAKKSVFIQTPTFNASPVIPATLDACRRDVEVTLYLDLGFNDLGEMIPFQGGTNEQVVHKMYKKLRSEGKGKHKNLKVYWYTAKDQARPIGAMLKKRNCHVKFMSVDDQVCILGNGNQDTQSWLHSQEVNIMVDSNQLAIDWLTGMNANQNTRAFGLVDDKDGIWRDKDGVKVQSSGVKSYGAIDWMRAISGAVVRICRKGGF